MPEVQRTATAPVRIPSSELDIEVLESPDSFMACADDVDTLFFRVHGHGYPYSSKRSFSSIGPDSKAICIRHGGRLVGFVGFIQDRDDNRTEIGRVVRHPDYYFEMSAIGEVYTRIVEDLRADPELLLYATTRIWITSYYLEIYDFEILGSYIYPVWVTSAWNDRLVNPFFGMYLLPKPQRFRKTAGLPPWVTELFPSWSEVFGRYRFEERAAEADLSPSVEAFPPEPGTDRGSDASLAHVPCVQGESIERTARSLVRDGYVLMAFLPAWNRVLLDDRAVYGGIGPTAVVMLILALATLQRDPKYLANMFFALGFFLTFLAMLLNILHVALSFHEVPRLSCSTFKAIHQLSTLTIVCFAMGQLVFLKGPRFVASRKGAAVLGGLTAASFLIWVGELKEIDPVFASPAHPMSFLLLLLVLNLLICSLCLGIGVLVLVRIGADMKRRYRVLLIGLVLTIAAYFIIILFRMGVVPRAMITGATVALAFNLGGILLYLGLIRR